MEKLAFDMFLRNCLDYFPCGDVDDQHAREQRIWDEDSEVRAFWMGEALNMMNDPEVDPL